MGRHAHGKEKNGVMAAETPAASQEILAMPTNQGPLSIPSSVVLDFTGQYQGEGGPASGSDCQGPQALEGQQRHVLHCHMPNNQNMAAATGTKGIILGHCPQNQWLTHQGRGTKANWTPIATAAGSGVCTDRKKILHEATGEHSQ